MIARACLLALSLTLAAHSLPLTDTTGNPTQGSGFAIGVTFVDPQYVAANFSGGPFTSILTSVEISVARTLGGALSLGLFSDSGGAPDLAAFLTDLTPTTAITSSYSLITFLPTTATTLSAGTVYWAVARSADPIAYGWQYANNGSVAGIDPGSPGFLGGTALSTNAGGSWIDQAPTTLIMRVNAEVVPEIDPGSGRLPLACFVTMALLAGSRRRYQVEPVLPFEPQLVSLS